MEIDNNYNQRITDFLIRHLDCAIKTVSLYYRFEEETIERHSQYIDWGCLSRNKNFQIQTSQFLEKFESKLNWKQISLTQQLITTDYILQTYNDKICWPSYFNNPFVNLDKGLFFNYSEKIQDLSSCTKISWTDQLIENYKENWNWNSLSSNPNLCWTIDLIEKYVYKWNWDNLSQNPNLPWSEELIDEYFNKWNWHFLTSNKGLPWSIKFIKKYNQKLSRYILPHNIALPWHKKDKLNQYIDCSIQKLSSNPKALPWSKEFLFENYKQVDFKMFSCNKGFPWELEVLEKFENKLNFDDLWKINEIWDKVFKLHITDEIVEIIFLQKEKHEIEQQLKAAERNSKRSYYSNDADNYKYYEEAAFNFLTEGEFGDYDEFEGNSDDVMTWLGRD